MRTFQVAIAKVQLRIIHNIRGVCEESEAFVSGQVNFAAIRLQTTDKEWELPCARLSNKC